MLPVRCPGCGMPSGRVHGRYTRKPRHALAGLTPVVIESVVRRFTCGDSRCAAVTFAEQVEGLTRPHARFAHAVQDVPTAGHDRRKPAFR
ncbi:transposase family protein [Streptomyces filipinensis]|uniref:transposase family protein n=1 Tax=Streptomyces filipinensis TaxID=66887 RepID=UPI0036EAE4AA